MLKMIGFFKKQNNPFLFIIVEQGCGNTILDLSNLVPFHSGQVRFLFTSPGTSMMNVNIILFLHSCSEIERQIIQIVFR